MTKILITGSPGVGKTTLVKRLAEQLRQQNSSCVVSGFFTNEVRGEDGSRLGFDITSFSGGETRPLARQNTPIKGPMVGKYTVLLSDFEAVAMSSLEGNCDVMLIDEIGKMELFSKRFERKVKSLFMEDGTEGITIVATVPVAKIPLVESLKSRPDCQVFVVTRDNRDHILDEILPLANSK